MKAYFEFDAQPAMITPYKPSEVIASRYSRPALAFDSTSCASNGTTAHAANAGTSVISGARMYSTRRSEEHTSELQSLMRNSYAVFCLKKKNQTYRTPHPSTQN